MKQEKEGSLRIIGGIWRGRKLNFLDREGLRPTPDRVRETLFNWLQADVAGSCCLDLFAGSGALGFESASRGANKVTMLDNDKATLSRLQDNIKLLHADDVRVIDADARTFLQAMPDSEQQFDIVFVDPPYQSDLLVPSCQLLEQQQWLSNHAKIYIESDVKKELVGLPESWQCLKSKKAGQVSYQLFIRK